MKIGYLSRFMRIRLSMWFIALFRTEKANLLLGRILAAQHMDCRRHRRDNLNAEQQRVLNHLHRVTSSPQYAYSSSPVIS